MEGTKPVRGMWRLWILVLFLHAAIFSLGLVAGLAPVTLTRRIVLICGCVAWLAALSFAHAWSEFERHISRVDVVIRGSTGSTVEGEIWPASTVRRIN